MKVCVVGLGYVGLPSALLFAREHEVVGVDVDPERVAALNAGELPFEEPGLPELFADVRENFRASERAEPADAYALVVPTPLDPRTNVADLSAVRAAGESVAEVLGPGELVVLESTVPPGTSERLLLPTLERGGLSRGEFGFAYCPERAIPGRTLMEMRENHRVVGALDERSAERVRELYSFVEGEIHETDSRTAEFVKVMENAYRDVNVAVANEFAQMAEELGVNVHDARALANEHPRVDVLSPGPGVGGHCISVDPQFLAQSVACDRLLSAARRVNDGMASHVFRLVRETTEGVGVEVGAGTLAVLGVAYKGNVGDTRRTPALPFVRLARNAGYDVRVYDPHVAPDDFDPAPEPLDRAVEGSDCLVVLADHDEFRELDPAALAPAMDAPAVVDARGVLDVDRWTAAGFDVRTLGDGTGPHRGDRRTDARAGSDERRANR